MLHAGATADLVWWTADQLTRWISDHIKRHAERHGVFVIRDTTTTLVNGTATYAAPGHHLDTIHVAIGGRALVASSTTELEALDDAFRSTAEATGSLASRWYPDRLGQNQIGIYPVPATGLSAGSALDVIYHGFICDDPFTAPQFVGDYLELAVAAEAYAAECDGQMVETAQSARQVMGLIDEIVTTYWGRAQ